LPRKLRKIGTVPTSALRMKIVYLAAGAGGMYCGSCLHDNTLAAALLALGEDALLVPTYTPLRTDEEDVSGGRLFFGGINVVLQQKSAVFRHTPWLVDKLLDLPALVKIAASFGPGVDAGRLGDLTVSMLRGEGGRQKKELDKLLRWLARDIRPDVVHLSNALLLGMARGIRELGIPVVCSLSGEDLFLDKLPPDHRQTAWQLLRERGGDVTAWVALNRYYAEFMAGPLGLDPARIDVVPHGVNLQGHGTRRQPAAGEPFTIGYLARVCPEKGLHQLVAAFELLARDQSLPPIKLKAAGYLGESDRPYLLAIRQRVAEWPEPDQFEYLGEVSRSEKIAFLQSLDAFAVPTVYRESKGLSAIEALANAVSVVLPAHGAFPELVADTGGGLLHEPDNPAALAQTLRRLILDPAETDRLGQTGQAAVRQRYHAAVMAQRTLDVYRRVVSSAGRPAS